jgi:hypothetical protein
VRLAIRRFSRALPLMAAALVVAASHRVGAQQMSQRGQPRTAFGPAEFGKLRRLEGTWSAGSQGESPMYERFHFVDDSTVEISYYRDAQLSQQTASGRIYLSVGRIYYSFGPNRWGATHVGDDGVFFVPQTNARNTFAWDFTGNDAWTSTMRSGLSGRDRATVWNMTRVK